MMKQTEIEVVETCYGCPHTFIFKVNEKEIGYLRFRFGHLGLYALNENGNIKETVFDYYSEHEMAGVIPVDKVDFVIEDCKRMLCEYFNNPEYIDQIIWDF